MLLITFFIAKLLARINIYNIYSGFYLLRALKPKLPLYHIRKVLRCCHHCRRPFCRLGRKVDWLLQPINL